MKNILAILPVSIGGRLTTSSIIDGFIQNNCRVFVYDELKDEKLSFLRQIKSFDFDFIIGYDFSPVKLKADNNLKFPCIAYFSDEINKKTSGREYIKYKKYLKNEDIFVFYWDRILTKEEKGVKNLFYMPHFVNCEIYGKPCLDYISAENDVLFAGRLDSDLRLEIFLELNKRLKDFRFAWYAIEKHYKSAIMHSKNDDERNIIKRSYKGFIDNEIDMAHAIANSKIVYNINSQGKSSLNYRTIQTLASKRLIISDMREELDLFDNIIPVYNNIDELADKIKYYLNNKKEYEKIVEKTYKTVRLNHNAKECVEKMLKKAVLKYI